MQGFCPLKRGSEVTGGAASQVDLPRFSSNRCHLRGSSSKM